MNSSQNSGWRDSRKGANSSSIWRSRSNEQIRVHFPTNYLFNKYYWKYTIVWVWFCYVRVFIQVFLEHLRVFLFFFTSAGLGLLLAAVFVNKVLGFIGRIWNFSVPAAEGQKYLSHWNWIAFSKLVHLRFVNQRVEYQSLSYLRTNPHYWSIE